MLYLSIITFDSLKIYKLIFTLFNTVFHISTKEKHSSMCEGTELLLELHPAFAARQNTQFVGAREACKLYCAVTKPSMFEKWNSTFTCQKPQAGHSDLFFVLVLKEYFIQNYLLFNSLLWKFNGTFSAMN